MQLKNCPFLSSIGLARTVYVCAPYMAVCIIVSLLNPLYTHHIDVLMYGLGHPYLSIKERR